MQLPTSNVYVCELFIATTLAGDDYMRFVGWPTLREVNVDLHDPESFLANLLKRAGRREPPFDRYAAPTADDPDSDTDSNGHYQS